MINESEKSRFSKDKGTKEEREARTIPPEVIAARNREAAIKKLKMLVANKDIYEFSDDEKELYISHNPEQFSHAEDDVEETCEFISSSPVAEAVLSDFFTKKERTKGMDFLFNFHTKKKCNS